MHDMPTGASVCAVAAALSAAFAATCNGVARRFMWTFGAVMWFAAFMRFMFGGVVP